jgi:hypothetical protein
LHRSFHRTLLDHVVRLRQADEAVRPQIFGLTSL